MCKTKKIIAGFLCAIVAGIGVIGINAQSVDAQTAANQGTIATAGMSLEQLQQIIELLKQQIQQIILLLQQRTYVQPVCGNGVCETAKGETAVSCSKDCGIGGSCPIAMPCNLDPGISIPHVAVWAKNPTTGECCQYGLACYAPTGWTTYSSVSECKGSITACAKEGGKIYPPSLADLRPAQCCAGLTAISSCGASGDCPNDGSSTCAYCGNGVCGLGENKVNCPKDCAFSCVAEGDISYLDGLPCCAGLERQKVAVVNSDSTCAIANLAGGRCTSAKCGNGVCETAKGENKCNCPADCGATDCAKEGEYITSSLVSALTTATAPALIKKECCAGLTAYKNGCNEKVVDGACVKNQYTVMCGSYLCVNCGDGKCNSAAGENICNCPADCGATTLSCDAKCKADNYESGLCKTWSGVGEVSYGNSYCSNAGETCYCKINSPYSAYPICDKTLSGSPTAEEVAQCAAAKGAIYCGNGWCKCANCGFINQATTRPHNPGKIVCSYGLNEDQCKSAGGNYVCPENYSITSSYLGTGSTATYYKSACFCSCPAPLDAMPTATSSSAPTGR